MICCINPNCEKPENPDSQTYCISCGIKLVPILRNRYRTIKFLGQGGFGRTYLAEDIDKLSQPPAPTLTPAPTLQRFDFEVVTVDVRGNISSRQRHQAQFISENLGSGAILDMVAIPGGRFVMGSPIRKQSEVTMKGRSIL